MQRQALPLLRPSAPIVGTGLEGKVARDSRMMINAEGSGVVESVDANEIVIRYDASEDDQLVTFENNVKTYKLQKFLRRSEEHTSELQSRGHIVCRLLLEKKK